MTKFAVHSRDIKIDLKYGGANYKAEMLEMHWRTDKYMKRRDKKRKRKRSR